MKIHNKTINSNNNHSNNDNEIIGIYNDIWHMILYKHVLHNKCIYIEIFITGTYPTCITGIPYINNDYLWLLPAKWDPHPSTLEGWRVLPS